MGIFRSRIFYIAVTAAIVPFAIVNLNFPESFTGYALASAFLIHVIADRKPGDWFYAVGVGLGLNILARWAGSFWHFPEVAPAFSLAMLGAGSLVVLGWRSCHSRDIKNGRSADAFLQATVLLVLVLASKFALEATQLRGPYVLDSYLLTYDESLGWRSTFADALLQRAPRLDQVIGVFYNGLPLVAALVCAAYSRYLKRPNWQLFRMVVTAGILGFVTYQIFPAVGPRHLSMRSGSLMAANALPPRPIPVALNVARNAMPSLHMGWALLIWLAAESLPWPFRRVAFSYMLLTPLLVLATGEHYVIDMVVAIPFCLIVLAICSESAAPVRWRAAGTGILLTGAWLVLLRWTSIFVSAIAAWSCLVVFTGISAFGIYCLVIAARKQQKSFAVALPHLTAEVAASEKGSLSESGGIEGMSGTPWDAPQRDA